MNLLFILKSFLLPIVIGSVSSLITAHIKIYHENKKYKLELLKEKNENFYLPFVNLYNKHTFGAINYTDLSQELQKEFYDLLIQYEYRYANETLSDLIYCFKGAFSAKCKEDLDDSFNELVMYIFELQANQRKELGY